MPSNLNAQQKLMAAALPLFLKDGVGGCRIEELFDSSGVSNGSFYHHFGSKPKLATAMYLEIQAEYHSAFLAELEQHKSARKGIVAMVGHHLAWTAQNVRKATYLFQCMEPEVLELCKEEEGKRSAAFMARCVVWLNGQAKRGALQQMSPVEWHILWMGPTLELTRNWLRSCSLRDFKGCDSEILFGLESRLSKSAWQAIGK